MVWSACDFRLTLSAHPFTRATEISQQKMDKLLPHQALHTISSTHWRLWDEVQGRVPTSVKHCLDFVMKIIQMGSTGWVEKLSRMLEFGPRLEVGDTIMVHHPTSLEVRWKVSFGVRRNALCDLKPDWSYKILMVLDLLDFTLTNIYIYAYIYIYVNIYIICNFVRK